MDNKMKDISMRLQETFGDKRIVIGRTDGMTYIDIPDDPETFADLMMRLFMTLGMENINGHIKALHDTLDDLQAKANQNVN